jgi:hypothetical protein
VIILETDTISALLRDEAEESIVCWLDLQPLPFEVGRQDRSGEPYFRSSTLGSRAAISSKVIMGARAADPHCPACKQSAKSAELCL